MAAFLKNRFDSHKQDWATPDSLYDQLNEEFQFTIDLAADASNAKNTAWYGELDDSLSRQWLGVCWLNPPYGGKKSKLSDWVRKARRESENNAGYTTVVMLIPARTNTRWWHEHVMKADEIRFINGRPKFGGAKHGLPQPLAIVVFRPHTGPTKLGSFSV